MIEPEVKAKYKVTIGIECHVQLKTNTKLFSGAGNDARDAKPNTLINHIDFGLPGGLPVLNSKAVELASRAGFALNSRPQNFSKFDRKHYFYPDLPLGYQITQFEQPVILGGSVEINVDGERKEIGITRAHLEADAGKSVHPAGKDYSLVDLNRAGTPLLEIVSEPEMHSAAEAKAYAHELQLLMIYSGASDANLFYGNMRFDVNVSVSKDDKLGVRTETKNLNSFRSIERAADFEINRQIELLENGEKIVQETRGWLDDEQVSVSQRSKENADDYRYMPDPDVPPIVLSDEYIDNIEKSMAPLPAKYREILAEAGIDDKTAEDVIALPRIASAIKRIFDKAGAHHARRIAFWLLGNTSDNSKSAENDIDFDDQSLVKLSQMVEDKKLSSTSAKEILSVIQSEGGDPEDIATRLNLLQISDESEIEKIVEKVILDNEKASNDVKNGEAKAIGFLVGQVMKQSKGQANPALATTLIKKILGL